MRRVRKSATSMVFIALLVTAVMPSVAPPASATISATGATATTVRASLRSELTNYLNAYRSVEHISAVTLAVASCRRSPAINISVGDSRYGGGNAVSAYALWQIGSNTKAFTSVVMLQLEAEHKLSINDTLGKWLPQYPAWRSVTIKQLLNMTSGIPNYTDSLTFWHDVAAAPNRVFSASRLVSYVVGLPPTHGYSYSNTNYILAQLVIRARHPGWLRQSTAQANRYPAWSAEYVLFRHQLRASDHRSHAGRLLVYPAPRHEISVRP